MCHVISIYFQLYLYGLLRERCSYVVSGSARITQLRIPKIEQWRHAVVVVKGVEYVQLYRKKSVWSPLTEERAGSFLVNMFFGVFATMSHHCAVPGCASNSRTVIDISIQPTQIFVVHGWGPTYAGWAQGNLEINSCTCLCGLHFAKESCCTSERKNKSKMTQTSRGFA